MIWPDLPSIWFVLVGVLFTGYAILDGFDFGVGMWHLWHKTDHDRRISINSIGPVWDGNEVWLVTGGGALFAAFPDVYATVFSGFYLAFMLLLVGLIFRAVAIEFRSKHPGKVWRAFWDISFCAASYLCSFLVGVALGNIVWGIPLRADMEFGGTFLGLLNPYALMLGLVTVAMFMMHGAIYLSMKTEGKMQKRVRTWINPAIIFFILCYAVFTLATLLYNTRLTERIRQEPIFFAVVVLAILAVANIPREISRGKDFIAFISSGAAMALMMALFAIGHYPYMVYSAPGPEFSLTVHNASSSLKTLKIMLTMAVMGLPCVIAYTVSIYWIFRGKTKLDHMSY